MALRRRVQRLSDSGETLAESLPTSFEPGSAEKIQLLKRRNELGFSELHVLGDAMSQHAAERLLAFAMGNAAGVWD
jgi:hypothetical protein